MAIKGLHGREGVALGVFLPHVLEVSPSFREEWSRVAAHLAAAARFKKGVRRDGLPEDTEAVLDAGVVVHAEGEARRARRILEHGTRRMVHARAVRDGEALGLWPALCEARWSLVEHFETDGRRFVVARRNATETVSTHGLTHREGEVIERTMGICPQGNRV